MLVNCADQPVLVAGTTTASTRLARARIGANYPVVQHCSSIEIKYLAYRCRSS